MVNYEDAIKKPFSDLSKLVIGIVLSIFPLVNFFSMGFILECTGLGKMKPSKKMPEWKNWSNLFFKGFIGFVVIFIYMIPALAVFTVGIGFTVTSIMGSVIGTGMTSDMMGMMNGEPDAQVFEDMFSQNWPVVMSTLLKATPIFLIGLVLMLLAFYLAPVALGNYLKKKRVSAAFELSTVFGKAFTSKYFVVWVLNMFISGLGMFVSKLLLFIGPSVQFFVVGVITYTIFGQVLRELKL